MSLYPKQRGVKKFAGGGVADPFLGVGIQYQQIAADVPNVDAAQAYADAEIKRRDYLEQERLKRKPSRAAAMEMVQKYEGTEGQKRAFQDEVIGLLDDYDKRARKDPNWVFSREGQDAYAGLIDATLNPTRVEQLSNNYKLIQSGYNDLVKNNTRDSYQISGNKVLARASDGTVSRVDISDIGNGYTAITGDEQYSAISSASQYTHDKDGLVPILNKDESIKNLLSGFDSATGMIQSVQGIMDVTSNSQALAAAKRQAIDTMSDQTKSSLQAAYLKISGGKYTKEGFDKYVDTILNDEVRKRKRSSSEISNEAVRISSDLAKGKETIDPSEQPLFTVTNSTMTVTDAGGIDKPVDVMVRGVSNIPTNNEIVPQLAVDGRVWSFGGGSWGSGFLWMGNDRANFSAEKNKDGAYGAPKKMSQRFENAQHVASNIMSVTTGSVFNEDGTRDAEVISNGSLILQSGDDEHKYGKSAVLKGSVVRDIYVSELGDDGKTYKRLAHVVPRSDGKLIEVKDIGVDAYRVNVGGEDATIMVPVSRQDALRKFGVNVSPYKSNNEYFVDGNKFPKDPNAPGRILLSKVATMNPQLHQSILNAIEQSLASNNGVIDRRVKAEINELLNYVNDKIEDNTIRQTFSIAKPNHTKKNEGDFIR